MKNNIFKVFIDNEYYAHIFITSNSNDSEIRKIINTAIRKAYRSTNDFSCEVENYLKENSKIKSIQMFYNSIKNVYVNS